MGLNDKPRHVHGSPGSRRRCRPGRRHIPAGLAKGGRVVGEEGEVSWWVYLGKTEPVEVRAHSEGGTYVLGGIDEATLNITYNYGGLFRKHLHPDGLQWLDDKRAKDTIKALESAVRKLGTKQDRNYWKETPGNAGHALSILLKWAKQHPRAKWVIH